MAKVIIDGLTYRQAKAIASYLRDTQHYDLNEHLWHEEVCDIEVLSVVDSESVEIIAVVCKPIVINES